MYIQHPYANAYNCKKYILITSVRRACEISKITAKSYIALVPLCTLTLR